MKNIDKLSQYAGVSEKALERYLVNQIKELGGECLKYSNPGVIGYPDRLCLLPGGYTAWVELKGKDGVLAPMQRIRLDRLTKLGQRVYVCSSRQAIDQVIHDYYRVIQTNNRRNEI